MRYWEVEFECDDSWSISGIYSFLMRKETKPTIEDIYNFHGVYPNKDGLGNIERIIDITSEVEHYDEFPDEWYHEWCVLYSNSIWRKIDNVLSTVQLYSYKLPTYKIGNWIMDFRKKYLFKKMKYVDRTYKI